MQRYRFIIAYLGTPYLGWQRQASGPTVQGALEEALTSLADEPVRAMGAGRTDAGVHAAGQVAHADLEFSIPATNLCKVLNARLPETIRILKANPASNSFHALAQATGKRYVYRAHFDGDAHPPWSTLRSASLRPPRNTADLQHLVDLIPGRRDWRAFTVPEPSTRTTVRTVSTATLSLTTRTLRLQIDGEGFVRYQVRRIVGALMQVAWGHQSPEWFARCLDDPADDPQIATAPARGLTLERVSYRGRRPGMEEP